jgi:hypothetical protein
VSPSYRDVLDYELGARIVVEFTTRQREVLDYAVILTIEDEGQSETVRGRAGSTRCIATAAAKERLQRRPSMPVPSEKGCGPRSKRFAPTTAR